MAILRLSNLKKTKVKNKLNKLANLAIFLIKAVPKTSNNLFNKTDSKINFTVHLKILILGDFIHKIETILYNNLTVVEI